MKRYPQDVLASDEPDHLAAATRCGAQLRRGELGHEVAIEQEWSGGGEMLLALHAYRSLASIRRFRLERGPDAPLVVALTGTDVYRPVGQVDAQIPLEHEERLIVAG